jgi:Tfp pilus assembly protein PilF
MKKLLLFLLLIPGDRIFAQSAPAAHHSTINNKTIHDATVTEYKKSYPTYPFGDPNPIPLLTAVYPYYRFDGFTATPVQKEWKVVELENDYIKILILPEIGGKIWTAIEKSTGRPFLYDNHAVKFRDIAMRGPWTSGGLESNFGIIGHTPNCATPVDYITKTNDDGSVSCIIGALDLLTRSNWRMEINLPKDKACFTTRAFWFNQTPVEQPYYHWMNAGLKAKGNLEFIYPGNRYLGHEGEYADWPINKKNGKNLSFYEQNNFGGFKSYHVFGSYADFAGAYWHDDDMGMVRYGTHDDKAGKKIWIWGLSRQGMIWEKMLTDNDGQYVELQSGRLFNQNGEKSTLTPFKHKSLQPYQSDTWIEYWYPVLATGGIVKANDYGALNMTRANGLLTIRFSPVQFMHDTLEIREGDHVIYRKLLILPPLQTFADSIPLISDNLPAPSNNQPTATAPITTVTIGRNKLIYSSLPHADDLTRPVDAPRDFDWNSTYGLFVSGKEAMDQKNFPLAEEKLRAAIIQDHNYLPALVKLAELMYRNMRYNEALDLSKRALSIDTEDGAANYYYGLINACLGRETDARDGFDIASLDPAFRSAAYIELSKIYLKQQYPSKALIYAQKALDFDRFAIEALQVQTVAYRYLHDEPKALSVMNIISGMDALNHFCRYEKYLWHPDGDNGDKKTAFTSLIRNELPQETYLEMGTWYYRIGCRKEAETLFNWCPSSTEAACWLAFLQNKPLDLSALNPLLSFPFRSETGAVLEQLLLKDDNKKPDHWLLKYHLALIYHDRNRLDECVNLLLSCKNDPDFAPFYAVRAAICKQISFDKALADLKKALTLDDNWRYRKLLTTWYLDHQEYANALAIVEPWYLGHQDQYIMGMLYAKTLLLNQRYADAGQILRKLNIIPFEGATEGHELYRETKLMQALTQMQKQKYSQALSFIRESALWPENLGVGKPYEEDIDQRLEQWLSYSCYMKMRQPDKANAELQKIIAFEPAIHNTVANFFASNALVTAWSLDKLSAQSSLRLSAQSSAVSSVPASAKDNAIKWLNDQLALFPGNKLLLWSLARYQKQSYLLPTADQDANARILEQLIQMMP